MKSFGKLVFGAVAFLATVTSGPDARAETSELRISRGFGIHYLALYVMESQRLIEKYAAAAGLGEIKVTWRAIDGGNVINDAMLAGALDIASTGVPGFLTLWNKAKGNPQVEVIGLGGAGSGSLWLNTRNPNVKTLADFSEKDRIAVPGIKTSFAAVVLQMAAAQAFGIENYAKLDTLTVGISHPDALAAMISGKSEIDSHFCSPPFSYLELDHPGIHRVVNSTDVTGRLTIIMAFTTRAFHDANPNVTKAFVAALGEATAFIGQNKHEAARIYVELAKGKATEAEIVRMLDDPDTHYTLTPEGVMKYADFMGRAGTIGTKPGSWKELFTPLIHDRPGS
jgi:NitT/TauT family transport system substrate-binding protein